MTTEPTSLSATGPYDCPPWPYCPRCGVHVADKTDRDGTIVCRFCRGHNHERSPGTTLCAYCEGLAKGTYDPTLDPQADARASAAHRGYWADQLERMAGDITNYGTGPLKASQVEIVRDLLFTLAPAVRGDIVLSEEWWQILDDAVEVLHRYDPVS